MSADFLILILTETKKYCEWSGQHFKYLYNALYTNT